MSLAIVAAEVADEAQVQDRVGTLGPNHVLELSFAQVHRMQTNSRGAAGPRREIDATDIVDLAEPPCDESA